MVGVFFSRFFSSAGGGQVFGSKIFHPQGAEGFSQAKFLIRRGRKDFHKQNFSSAGGGRIFATKISRP
jgi:hypothetical protein